MEQLRQQLREAGEVHGRQVLRCVAAHMSRVFNKHLSGLAGRVDSAAVVVRHLFLFLYVQRMSVP
jgi:hypothetical protein